MNIKYSFLGKREQDLVRQAILYHWNGIPSEKPKLINKNSGKSNCYQFKLLGQPFCDDNIKEMGVAIRRMAAKILLDLYNVGWKVRFMFILTSFWPIFSGVIKWEYL